MSANNSVPELIVGKSLKQWRAIDLWKIRLVIGALGVIVWFILALIVYALNPHAIEFDTAIAVGFIYAAVLCLIAVKVFPSSLLPVPAPRPQTDKAQ